MWNEQNGTGQLSYCQRSLWTIRVVTSILMLPVLGALFSACGSRPPKTVDEAGTVRVSISSIGRWSDYKEALQPSFTLNEADALDAVMPTTRLQEDKSLNAFGAGLAVSLPTTTTTSTVNTLPSGLPAADPGLTTVLAKSGDTTSLNPEVKTAGARTAGTLPGFDALASTALGKDPMLRYWTAAALYQEVRLLNRYIKDAAAKSQYVPYVVRFNIGLMPRRRGLSLDTYLNLAFFVGDEERCSTDRQAQTAGAASPQTCALPEVLPLLVTDNVEAALHSKSADDLSAFALALSGTINGIGASANLDKLHEQFARILGRDVNNLLMVSRLTSNTLRVRFGAMQQADSDFAMVPRNQFVTAVVLVPVGVASNPAGNERRLHVWTGMEFVDTTTGHALGEKAGKKDKTDVELIANRYGQIPDAVESAWQDVLAGDWSKFVSHFTDRKDLREMWLDIAQLQAGYSFDVLAVELPVVREQQIFPKQRALLLDDGKDKTIVQLVGGSGMNSDELCAGLALKDLTHQVAARKVTVSLRGTFAEFEFPSLKAWGLDRTKAEERKLWVRSDPNPATCWMRSGAANNMEQELETDYRLTQPEIKLGFDANVVSGVVVAKDGKGTLRFELTPSASDPAESVKVSLSGADVTSISTAYRDSKKPTQISAAEKRTVGIGADFDVTLKPTNVAVVIVELDNLKVGSLKATFANAKGDKLPTRDVPVEKAGT